MSSSVRLTTGVIGLGNMGGRVARRIDEVGHPLIGYDLSAQAREHSGLTTVDSIAELVEQVDVVMLSLPDSTIIEAVVLGPGGILEHARREQSVVDLSTASPASTVELHRALAAKNVGLVDAGLTGGSTPPSAAA